MVDLGRVDDETALDEVWEILALSLGCADATSRRRVTAMYLAGGHGALWRAPACGVALGVVGARVAGLCGQITHCAVRSDAQGHGLGRALVAALRRRYPDVRTWIAETDDGAVGFYRALGFAVVDLGERYPGVRRYRCRLAAARPH